MLYATRIGRRLAIGWSTGTFVSALGVYLSLKLDFPAIAYWYPIAQRRRPASAVPQRGERVDSRRAATRHGGGGDADREQHRGDREVHGGIARADAEQERR